MRAPLLALLLAGLPVAASGQQSFSDSDFSFSIDLPEGLVPVDEAGRAKLLGDAAAARNLPRAEAAGQPVIHRHIWLDQGSPYHRQVEIYLLDAPPPWNPLKPADFAEAIGPKQGLTVEAHELLKPPAFGLRVEGTFLREPDKVPMRKVILYLPDVFGKRHGLVMLQAQASDWNIVKDEFAAALASVRMPRAPPPPELVEKVRDEGAAGGGPGSRPGAAPAPAAPVEEPGDWSSLPVLGSFALAVVLLVHLLLSARTPR